jgi:hypothetical protein
MILTILVSIVAFLLIALPLKNWIELRSARKKDAYWSNWVNAKPSKTEFCKQHSQDIESPECDFCGCKRIVPSLEMVIPYNPTFGIIYNRYQKFSYFKTYIRSQCNSDLFRERYED